VKKLPSNPDERQMEEIEQKKKDYIAVFSTAEGKRVLADLENVCFIHRTTYSNQEGRTLLNEGMRFVVVHIKNIMNMNVEKLKKLIQKGE
jgi:hypothetical protein